MGFNKLNSVEHYIIHQLSGMNLNTQVLEEPKANYGKGTARRKRLIAV
ncbi:hypothetical protein C900_00863 [Fulvivirga imtechensis AK7]|uniref:Uncharacterized protein n=1 Tax=Fulvivirga imtechensis AK7 TaxID=1237149 RepID=L8K099_9BACT|nr:hypothetical protein [Fulvivirga imtechensis]ELR72902.1 hypothetical protein C900_00863 [Fulvivirga imtechensis AK7]